MNRLTCFNKGGEVGSGRGCIDVSHVNVMKQHYRRFQRRWYRHTRCTLREGCRLGRAYAGMTGAADSCAGWAAWESSPAAVVVRFT